MTDKAMEIWWAAKSMDQTHGDYAAIAVIRDYLAAKDAEIARLREALDTIATAARSPVTMQETARRALEGTGNAHG